jgi:ribose/xylose/arabinose/galactoside ABC-type transport system permease subunit
VNLNLHRAAPGATARRSLSRNQMLSFLTREIGTILLILLVIACLLASPDFMTRGNMENLADQLPPYGILAVAQMLAILTGGINLSMGSMLALGAFFCATQSPHGTVAAIVVPIVICGLMGMCSGLIIAFTTVPPFIVTLAMLYVVRGMTQQFANIYSGNQTASAIAVDPGSWIIKMHQHTIFGLPLTVYVMVGVILAIGYMLHYSRLGRHIYSIGGNEAAALLLGVRVRRTKVMLYTLTASLAGLAGVVFASRLASAPPTAGQGYEFIAITAVVVGGTLLTGGVGTMRGTAVGLLVVGILPNIFDLLKVGQDYQQVWRGCVLLGVVLLQLAVLPITRIGGLPIRTAKKPPVEGAAPPAPAAPAGGGI